MKKLFLFLLAQTILGQAYAQMQGHYNGRVLDAISREPVIGATLTVDGQPGGARSDTAGAFQLTAQRPEGGLELRIKAIGYNAWTGTLADPSREQTILLVPSENALGTIVVSATMKEVSKDVSPIPVEIYTPKFFQKNATPNLFEALSIVNGVRPQLNCSVCNTGDIHINGLEGPYTMVMIDGMPIVSGLSTVYGLSGIPNGLSTRMVEQS
jgi:outer membrane receptor for ferrienterochelin and colicins